MPSNRIRSSHQRRILDWLADGGGTVTEVSNALSMRVPHASAALKQLRESGDVVRDDVHIRGSRYRLSSQGLERLEADGLDRLCELVQWPPPPGAAGIVLAREGPMLLLGYASRLQGPLLGLPERPMDSSSGVIENSNGNEGESEYWRWAVTRGDGVVWFDIETKRRADPPNESSPQTLSAWMERPKVMGIVRARLLDENNAWPLGVGSWFTSLPEGYWPNLPLVLRDGDAPIGRAGNSGPEVRPRGAVLARLGRRMDRSLLLNTVVAGADCMADGDLTHSSIELPLSIVKSWLEIQHPRSSAKIILEKYSRLSRDLLNGISNTGTRKLLKDFPGRTWVNQHEGIIDTRGISLIGARACLNHLLENSIRPLVVDWRWGDAPELTRLANDQRCRVIVAEGLELDLPFVLTRSESEDSFVLQMQNRLHIPIRLNLDSNVPIGWIPPENPKELVRGTATNVSDADDELDALWKACSLGAPDDAWADRHESRFPLAAWISTSPSRHGERWRRIGEHLDVVWSEIADMNSFDDRTLSDLAMVQSSALDLLVHRVRSEPLKQRDTNHPAIATAILLSSLWLENDSKLRKTWISNPIRVAEVLRVHWDKPYLEELVSACPIHSSLYSMEGLGRDEMLAIMEDVHHDLWAIHSPDWLRFCLSSTMGRSALSQLQIPWPAVLYQTEIDLETLRLVHHMPDGPGKESLLDVVDGIEARDAGKPPVKGRTHDYSGWLFQKEMPIIPIEPHGDMYVHVALHRRIEQ